MSEEKNKKERRFERTDFVVIDDHVEFLLGLQQARFDKKNFGTGDLNLQELAEYIGANQLLEKIEHRQKITVDSILQKWNEIYNNDKISYVTAVQEFNKFLNPNS